MITKIRVLVIILLLLIIVANLCGQESAESIGKKLANPVANMISVPIQNNIDYGIGDYNGSKYLINVQPVVPITLTPKLNLITRYILPIIAQRDVSGDRTNDDGLGDLTISAFLAPNHESGLIWGAGPILLIPTSTNDQLGGEKWGIGPTVLLLKQSKGFTYGILASQTWSIAGDKQRSDVSLLFLQPFLGYNWKSGAGVTMNIESSTSWITDYTNSFLHLLMSGVTKLGKQTVSLAIGPRIQFAGPEESRSDFGLRAVVTFVFPKG